MQLRPGFLFSSAAHAALLAYAFIGLSSAKPFDVGPTEALPIEILTPQEFDAMTKGSKSSKKIDAPKQKAEKVAAIDDDPADDDTPIAKEDVKAPPPPKAEAAPPPPKADTAKAEAEKADAEKAAKAEAEKTAKAEAAKEKAEAEKTAKAEAAKAEQAKAAQEKAAQEKAEKLAQAAEGERLAKAEAEKVAKEKAEKVAKAEAEKAAKEKAEAEKTAKLEADKIAKAEAEKAAKEKAEKLAKLEAEKSVKEKAAAEKAAKAAERKFDPNKIASLLADKKSSTSESAMNDVRDPGRKERGARELAPETTAGTSRGTAAKLSMSQRTGIDNAVREQVAQCWNPPVGGVAGESMIVRVKFTLNADGSLSGGPTVDNSGASRAAADAAMRAVRRCSPLKLPAEAYDYWRQVDIRFDPKDMMGG